jgi:hypothetical protein
MRHDLCLAGFRQNAQLWQRVRLTPQARNGGEHPQDTTLENERVSVGRLSGFGITPPDGRSEGEKIGGESLSKGETGVNDKRVPRSEYKAGTRGQGITGGAGGGAAIGSQHRAGGGQVRASPTSSARVTQPSTRTSAGRAVAWKVVSGAGRFCGALAPLLGLHQFSVYPEFLNRFFVHFSPNARDHRAEMARVILNW